MWGKFRDPYFIRGSQSLQGPAKSSSKCSSVLAFPLSGTVRATRPIGFGPVVDVCPPLVRWVCRALPPDVLTRTARHINRGQWLISGRVPLGRNVVAGDCQRFLWRKLSATTRAVRAAAPVCSIRYLRWPLMPTAAFPPNLKMRLCMDAKGRQRAVPTRVPLSCDIGVKLG